MGLRRSREQNRPTLGGPEKIQRSEHAHLITRFRDSAIFKLRFYIVDCFFVAIHCHARFLSIHSVLCQNVNPLKALDFIGHSELPPCIRLLASLVILVYLDDRKHDQNQFDHKNDHNQCFKYAIWPGVQQLRQS